MNTEKYNPSIMSQLNNKECYTPLTRNPREHHKSEIDQILEKALQRAWITEKEKDFFTVKHQICPVFFWIS